MSTAMSVEFVLEESQRDGRGRRLESRAKLVVEYRTSSLTVAAFVREAEVKYPTFVPWVCERGGRVHAYSNLGMRWG